MPFGHHPHFRAEAPVRIDHYGIRGPDGRRPGPGRYRYRAFRFGSFGCPEPEIRQEMVEILEKGPLMEAARLLGRHALIDTRPNPEHSSEWIENTTGIVDFFPDEFHRTA